MNASTTISSQVALPRVCCPSTQRLNLDKRWAIRIGDSLDLRSVCLQRNSNAD